MSHPNRPPDPNASTYVPPLPYAGVPPMYDRPTPRSIAVLSVIGIVVASLSLMCKSANVVLHTTNSAVAQQAGQWDFIDSVLSVVFAAVLLIASIHCIRRRPWARQLMLIWATFYLLFIVVDIVGACTWGVPHLIAQHRQKGQLPPGFETGAYIGAVGVLLACAVYPIFVLVFMRKAEVIDAFENP